MAITSALTYTHTSVQQIKDLYGEEAFNLALHKMGDTTSRDRFMSLVIDDATTEVDMYLWQRYDQADYTSSPWVQSRTTWIAAHNLSVRTAQPGYFQSMYEKAIDDLERVKDGELSIPDVPLRSNTFPSMSNIVIDDAYGEQRQRVQQTTSVGETYPDQHVRYNLYFPWL